MTSTEAANEPDIEIKDGIEGVKVAVVGCGHGELDKMYETLAFIEKKRNIKVDLLLVCGDFQAVRNASDLENMACPPRFRHMNTFYKYYSGEKVAPVLTLYIAGNHEASNYHLEIFHGGWAAPNIYFLGWSGVVNFAGLRIAGLSGIFNSRHFKMGHHECPPFTESSKRSIYHVREYDMFKMLQITGKLDICMSHDWPRGIARHGNTEQLLRKKKFLRQEVNDNSLGSPAAAKLLQVLQPTYWFSAHLHVKFPALVQHASGNQTRFLALDKCLPHRDWMQVIEFSEARGDRCLRYDAEWLAILKSTNFLLSPKVHPPVLPIQNDNGIRFDYRPRNEELKWIQERLKEKNTTTDDAKEEKQDASSIVPLNFVQTAPAHTPDEQPQPIKYIVNPQAQTFHRLLDMSDILCDHFCPDQKYFSPSPDSSSSSSSSQDVKDTQSTLVFATSENAASGLSQVITSMDVETQEIQAETSVQDTNQTPTITISNPDEIDLDIEDDDDSDSDSEDEDEE